MTNFALSHYRIIALSHYRIIALSHYRIIALSHYIIPKQYMRQIVTLLLFLSSLCGFSQLYVAEGAVFSIPSSELTFSSQESIKIKNSSVKGQGLLYFNGEVVQQLNSSETVITYL